MIEVDQTIDDKVEIWLFILSLSSGGAERNLIQLANNLRGRGFNVIVYTVFENNPLQNELDEEVEVRTLNIPGVMGGKENTAVKKAEKIYHYPLAVVKFLIEIRKHRPDVVHSYLFYDNVIARLSKLVSQNTVIITGVRSVPESQRRIESIIDRLTVPLSDHIISNTKAGKSMMENFGVPSSDISVIRNAKYLDRYMDAPESDIRKDLNIPENSTLVGNVGRLIKRKGQYDLVEAWSKANFPQDNVFLVIVGDGPEYEEIQRKITKLGISDSVFLIGHRDNVPELLHSFDVFVFPSHFEGLPGALIEAMAAGLPIIATDIPGNNELLSDSETAMLVPPRSPGRLAIAICTVLSNNELASKLAKNAKSDVEGRFLPKNITQQHIDLYYELIRGT